jgi:hypothetical protein
MEMAATTIMSQVACTTGAKLGFGLQSRLSAAAKTSKYCSGTLSPRLMTSLASRVRCDARDNGTGLREAVDQVTKKTITKEDILRNQETNESEKKSVFGTEPTSGSLYPRPKVETQLRAIIFCNTFCNRALTLRFDVGLCTHF